MTAERRRVRANTRRTLPIATASTGTVPHAADGGAVCAWWRRAEFSADASPWGTQEQRAVSIKLTGEPLYDPAPERFIAGPGQELRASPVRRAVGCEGTHTSSSVPTCHEQGIVIQDKQKVTSRARSNTVLPQKVRPLRWQSVCNWVLVQACGTTPCGVSTRSSWRVVWTGRTSASVVMP